MCALSHVCFHKTHVVGNVPSYRRDLTSGFLPLQVILENVDLSLPVHIGVQTLGSNGLSSGRVTTVFRTSLSPGPGSPGAAGPGLPTAEALELRETVGL